jgi:chromosome partitioning protein
MNAIAISDYYLISMQAEYFSLKGLLKLIGAVDYIKQGTDSEMELLGVFLTRFNRQKTLSRDVHEITREQVKDHLLRTFVRENIALVEAQAKGISIFDYDTEMERTSNGATDYRNLCEEILARLSL